MDKQGKIQQVNDSIQNTMTSTIGIEITDIENDYRADESSFPSACSFWIVFSSFSSSALIL